MIRRLLAIVPVAIAVAAVCLWAGFWQLDRLALRRARNAQARAAFVLPPVPVAEAGARPVRFRRVLIEGTYEFAEERSAGGKSHHGSPGVHILTPLRLSDGSVVLVNRGWAYSPNASTVDLSSWREEPHASGEGYVDYPRDETVRRTSDTISRARATTPRDFVVVALADSAELAQPAEGADSRQRTQPPRLARLDRPAFDEEGPHLSYAVQWFTFATIALVGGAILARRELVKRGGRADSIH